MTVKDERAFLRLNVLYHRFLGVDSIYIYDDGSTDGGVESISDLPYVKTRSSVGPDEAPDWPPLAQARGSHKTFFVARQMLNVAHAMERARSDGIDWLLMIDADELAAVDRKVARQGSLGPALNRLASSINEAIFRPLEAVQRRGSNDDVMSNETKFKRVSGTTRKTLDPFTKETHPIAVVYGHKAGKAAVRLTASAYPKNPHRFMDLNGRRLSENTVGDVLHYYAPSFEEFVHKYRNFKNHPDKQLHGNPLGLPKRLWRDIVNTSGWDEGQLRDYYDNWVAFSDDEIDRMSARRGLLRRQPIVVEVPSAREVIRAVGPRGSTDVASGE